MKKFKIAALGLAALVTGASAFTVKHATKKFASTYYVLVTNASNTRYQLTLLNQGDCGGTTSKACAVHITAAGSTVKTGSGTIKNTWVRKTSVTTVSRKFS